MSSPTKLQLQQAIYPFQKLAFACILVALSSRCICLWLERAEGTRPSRAALHHHNRVYCCCVNGSKLG